MSIFQLYSQIKDHLGFIWVVFIICSSLVQISPIKLNPWSFIAHAIGKALNGDLSDKLLTLDKKVDGIRSEIAEDKAKSARRSILQFGDELLMNQKHSKEAFDSVLDDIDAYEKYCSKHPEFKNSMTVMAAEHIRNIYRECREKHSFLYGGE